MHERVAWAAGGRIEEPTLTPSVTDSVAPEYVPNTSVRLRSVAPHTKRMHGAGGAVGLAADEAIAVDCARGAVAGVTDEAADRRQVRRAGLEPKGALDAVTGEPGSGDLSRVVDAARKVEAAAERR